MEHGSLPSKTKIDPRLPEFDVKKPDELDYAEPFGTYLADRSCISSSGVRRMMNSPYAFWYWSKHAEEEEDEADHFRIGKAAHLMVLENQKFREHYVVQPDFGAMQSPKNRAKRDEWRAELPAEAVVVTQKELDMLVKMTNNLLNHKTTANFFHNGKPEVTGRFTHPETGIRCRIRPDYFCYDSKGDLFIFDLKTTRVDSESLFKREMEQKRYYEQVAFYAHGMSLILKKQVAGIGVVGMSKSEEAGYPIWLEWVEDDSYDIAKAWNDEALRNLKRSLLTDKWPHQQTEGSMASMSPWRKSEAFPQFDY